MKKITLIILVLMFFGIATQVSAAHEPPTTGDLICIHPLCNPPAMEAFPANSPFFIKHGWLFEVGTQAIGTWDFNLIVDGVPVQDGIRIINIQADAKSGSISRLYNYPDGLPAGVHTLKGVWIIACQYGPDPSSCMTPNEPVVASENTVIVTFTEP